MSLYVVSYPQRSRAVELLASETSESIADAARFAGIGFMEGIASGWNAHDLADWLKGAYRYATRYRPRGERIAASSVSDRGMELHLRVATLMGMVHASSLAVLEDASQPGGRNDFVADAIRCGAVVPARASDGTMLWIPVDGGRMRLRDRVLALFATDYLLRPVDYVADLFICPRCESVLFDGEARTRGYCSRHHRVSGVVAAPTATGDALDEAI